MTILLLSAVLLGPVNDDMPTFVKTDEIAISTGQFACIKAPFRRSPLVITTRLGQCWDFMADPIRVIDGDTVVLNVLKYDNESRVETVRLLGVNAPEMTGITKEAGLKAKHFTEVWLGKSRVNLSFCRRDHFGRILGRVTDGGEDLSNALLNSGNGVEYK